MENKDNFTKKITEMNFCFPRILDLFLYPCICIHIFPNSQCRGLLDEKEHHHAPSLRQRLLQLYGLDFEHSQPDGPPKE